MLKLLDLFSGIGGFSYAAEHLLGGFTTTQFVECSPYCQTVLKKHWPTVPIHDDICTYTAEPGEFDVICGGFPCQDISAAGNQTGLQGSRSGLFYEVMRLVRTARPRFVLLENVGNLLSHANGQTFQEVIYQISKAGYDAEWACIPASDVGACHKRNRMWIVAYTNHPRLEGWESVQRQQSTEQRPTWTGDPCAVLFPDWRSFVSQPVIRRGDDGFSAILDSVRRLIRESDDPQSLAAADQLGREVLRELWRRIFVTAASSELRQPRGSDPLSEVPYGHPHERWNMGQRRRAVLGGLRDLWYHISQETISEDSDLLAILSIRASAPEIGGAVGFRQRVDRLKALGNAVVPQVAAIPLRRIRELARTA